MACPEANVNRALQPPRIRECNDEFSRPSGLSVEEIPHSVRNDEVGWVNVVCWPESPASSLPVCFAETNVVTDAR